MAATPKFRAKRDQFASCAVDKSAQDDEQGPELKLSQAKPHGAKLHISRRALVRMAQSTAERRVSIPNGFSSSRTSRCFARVRASAWGKAAVMMTGVVSPCCRS